jgi:hypothetical protein
MLLPPALPGTSCTRRFSGVTKSSGGSGAKQPCTSYTRTRRPSKGLTAHRGEVRGLLHVKHTHAAPRSTVKEEVARLGVQVHHLDRLEAPGLPEQAAHFAARRLLCGESDVDLLDLAQLSAAQVKRELVRLRRSARSGQPYPSAMDSSALACAQPAAFTWLRSKSLRPDSSFSSELRGWHTGGVWRESHMAVDRVGGRTFASTSAAPHTTLPCPLSLSQTQPFPAAPRSALGPSKHAAAHLLPLAPMRMSDTSESGGARSGARESQEAVVRCPSVRLS